MIDLVKVEEIEEKLEELDQMKQKVVEEDGELNELQGKLKTKIWTGDKEDENDSTMKHSNLE